MHQYLSDTEYAIHGLFALIGDEERNLNDLQQQLESSREKQNYANSILYAGAPPSAFGEDTTLYFEILKQNASVEIENFAPRIASLQAAIDAKAFSVRAIAGAILQVGKQGIVVAHGGLTPCPSGRSIGSEVLKNVIWQGRNQAMHWEEGRFHANVTQCFQNLETDFGPQFRIDVTSKCNLAKEVIDLLQWTDFNTYENDMISLIG